MNNLWEMVAQRDATLTYAYVSVVSPGVIAIAPGPGGAYPVECSFRYQ